MERNPRDLGPKRDALTLHCSSCGAPFPAAATRCPHCTAEITLEERNLDALCDVCGARMSSQARFCMRCGKPAALQPTKPLAEGASCPRCRKRLRERTIPGGSLAAVIECESCAGLWLAPAALDRMCASAEAMQDATRHLLGRPATGLVQESKAVTYLACPSCKDMMVRRNFGGSSGVIVDVCKDHGVWLDHAELERVLAFVRAGGLEKARQREVERLQQEARAARERRVANSAPGMAMSGPVRGEIEYGLGELFGDLLGMFRRKRG